MNLFATADTDITLEQLNPFLEKDGIGMRDVVDCLFHNQMTGLDEEWMTVYVNEKMKESGCLKDYILKVQPGNEEL